MYRTNRHGRKLSFNSGSRRSTQKVDFVIRWLEGATKRLVKSESGKDLGKDSIFGGHFGLQLAVFEKICSDLHIVTLVNFSNLVESSNILVKRSPRGFELPL